MKTIVFYLLMQQKYVNSKKKTAKMAETSLINLQYEKLNGLSNKVTVPNKTETSTLI